MGHAAAQGIVHSVSGAVQSHKVHKEEEKRKKEQESAAKHSQSMPAMINPHASAPVPPAAPVPAAAPVQPVPSAPTQHPAEYFTAPTLPACAPPARPPPPLHHMAQLKKDFVAHTAAELSVAKGEIVEVLHSDPSGWDEVLNAKGAKGWVPAAYLDPK